MGDILTFQQAKQTYQLCGSYLDYVGLIGSLSREWKSLPKKVRAEYPVIHPQVQFVLSKENGAKYLYNVILQNKTKNFGNSWELGWEIKYGEINWPEVYRAIYQKSSVYYHVLSYKIITETVATYRLLHAMGIRSSPICSRCKLQTETVEHKFWLCCEVNQFWKNITEIVNSMNATPTVVTFNSKKVILGETDDYIIKRIIFVGKGIIMTSTRLCVELFIKKFKIDIANERCVTQRRGKMSEFRDTWGSIEAALETL